VRQLVVVRQVGSNEAPLLPPPQAYFVRENLRLRLLNARISLLTRDEAGLPRGPARLAGLDPALFRHA
jgi:uroporphyrin-3 C-methyltransferase/uroporphyrinogen III methyltransferase/synthase